MNGEIVEPKKIELPEDFFAWLWIFWRQRYLVRL